MHDAAIVLDVPYFEQQHDCSCFPTCLKMVLAYYGETLDEMALYNQATLPGHNGTWDVTVAPPLLEQGYRVTSYWDGDVSGWKVPAETVAAYHEAQQRLDDSRYQHRTGATVEQIIDLISRDIPVIAEVYANGLYHREHGWTHMITLIGKDDTELIYHDPHRIHGGPYHRIDIARFAEFWEQLSPTCGRSMVIIHRKEQL